MAEKKRALLVSKREKRESRVNYQTYVKQMYETSLPLRLLHLLFPFDCCYLLLDCCFSSRSLRVLVKLLPIRSGSSLGSNSGRNTRWRSCAEGQQSSESPGTIGRSKGAAMASSHQQISVTIATEFVRWNEEAVSRCTLFSSQPAAIAANVRAVFTCLLNQVSIYITEGLERARDSLTEAAALRERFVVPSVSRRVAAAAASAAEAAAAAGESSFRSFMVSVQCCGSSVAIVQQYFSNSIFRLLLSVDGAHAASCEEMAIAMSSAEGAAYKGLQQCIETVMAESCRIPFKGA